METPAAFLARWHYAGLFLVILAEEAGVPLPIPGDLFIAAMGFMAQRGGAAFLPTAAVVTTATVLGASILYLVSRHAGRPLLVRVARRFGFTEAREQRLEGWLATLTAALSAGVAYASLLSTDFRGFAQFGLIGGLGMSLSWLFAYLVVPPLTLAWERSAPLVQPGQRPARPVFTLLVAWLVERRPRTTAVAALLLSAAAVVMVVRFARDPLEYDFKKLRDRGALREGGPAWWDARVDALFGDHLTPTVLLAETEAEAREQRLEGWLARHGALAVVVGRLIPGLRIVMTVVAGVLRLDRATFVTGTFFAGIIWSTIYFWLGYALGEGTERLGGFSALAGHWPWALAAAGVLGLATLWWRRARAAR